MFFEALRAKTKALAKSNDDVFTLASSLAAAYDVYENWGFKNFRSYVETELGLKYRKAMYYINAHNIRVKYKMSEAACRYMGWDKMVDFEKTVPASKRAEHVKLIEMAASSVKSEGSLFDRYIVPPFSVLNTNAGYWQDRKSWWLARKVHSEYDKRERVKDATLPHPDHFKEGESGLGSLFDPVLCEIMYSWFCPAKGSILDPFAGGAVRGIVAADLGYRYIGIDLNEDQIRANRELALARKKTLPVWITESSQIALPNLKENHFDFLFSCPPYYDLERYSDDPKDLSVMSYEDFHDVYSEIITASVALLKPNRFACFVVGNVRNNEGALLGLPEVTAAMFIQQGLMYYNDFVLVTKSGSGAMRAGRAFESSRKMTRNHQSVLVFCKGDPAQATLEIKASHADAS